MSVSQVKKRFAEFESFLRSDKEGLRRLKLLKDDVNVLRTSLAAAVESEELAQVITTAARERADKAETEAEELRVENQTLRDRIASLQSALRTPVPDDETDEDDEDETFPDEYAKGMKSTLKALRKGMELPRCPRPAQFQREPGTVLYAAYNRDDLAKGWSHRSLHVLGAATAILAEYEGQVTIKANTRARDENGKPLDMTAVKHFVKWFEGNIDKRPEDKRTARLWRDAQERKTFAK